MTDTCVAYSKKFEGGFASIDELTVVSHQYGKVMVRDRNGIEVEFEYRIGPDDLDYKAECDEINRISYGCTHQNTELRLRRLSDGRETMWYQCLDCGRAAGSSVKKTEWPAIRPAWDLDVELNMRTRMDYLRGIADLKQAIRWQRQQQDRSSEYAEYLNSPVWRTKRQKVLERDNYVCCGCLVNKATQVHHLTYEHIYDELLFELVSICDDCHAKAHPEKNNE